LNMNPDPNPKLTPEPEMPNSSSKTSFDQRDSEQKYAD
jgi:hypothetical protein